MGAGFHCCGPFESSDKPRLEGRQREVDMQGAEPDEPEMSFRRGYQQGAIELFYAIERFLDPATREVVRAWIEKDVYIWRVKAMLGHPPNWRLNMISSPRSAGRPHGGLDRRYAAGAGL